MRVYDWLVRKSWRINQRVLKAVLVIFAITALPMLVVLTYVAASAGIPASVGVSPWVPTVVLWLVCMPVVLVWSTRVSSSTLEPETGRADVADPEAQRQPMVDDR